MSRPHYLPAEAWMGVVIGEWPLYAFPDRARAAVWAADEPRRRVWQVSIPADTPVSRGTWIPRRAELEDFDLEDALLSGVES